MALGSRIRIGWSGTAFRRHADRGVVALVVAVAAIVNGNTGVERIHNRSCSRIRRDAIHRDVHPKFRDGHGVVVGVRGKDGKDKFVSSHRWGKVDGWRWMTKALTLGGMSISTSISIFARPAMRMTIRT